MDWHQFFHFTFLSIITLPWNAAGFLLQLNHGWFGLNSFPWVPTGPEGHAYRHVLGDGSSTAQYFSLPASLTSQTQQESSKDILTT